MQTALSFPLPQRDLDRPASTPSKEKYSSRNSTPVCPFFLPSVHSSVAGTGTGYDIRTQMRVYVLRAAGPGIGPPIGQPWIQNGPQPVFDEAPGRPVLIFQDGAICQLAVADLRMTMWVLAKIVVPFWVSSV